MPRNVNLSYRSFSVKLSDYQVEGRLPLALDALSDMSIRLGSFLTSTTLVVFIPFVKIAKIDSK